MRGRNLGSVITWTIAALAASVCNSPAQACVEEWPYSLAIDAQLQVKSPGQLKPQPLETATRMRYSLTPVENGQEVTIRGLALTVSSEGKVISEVQLSRAEAKFQQGDQKPDTVTFERAPKELKATLSQFNEPMARIETDANGAETSRVILVEKESTFVENGIVDNTRLFHPPFPAGRETWDAPCRLSMGEGQFASGNLTYRNIGTGPDGTVQVSVAGELKPVLRPGGDIRDGSYKVTGEQLFDPARNAWVSGRWTIDVLLNMQAEGQATGTANGTMELKLQPDTVSTEPATPAGIAVEAPRPGSG